ncbi:ATP synthase F1 subunit epsilon [Candidatus Collierbacteria bacterium CG10_big_fil_rev_8_21_14_0_10_44_9]|uniref:ATP synthase epsilon chain n=1 Tax=Candidatus Collierbacteria bacterium CG10_big_fil_rev_8_21_14_0_10_44_9 TaxID=1974535 RepID=A0A2H0VJF9_9BACT|nr:MAG: ATP synthase F1 subunit epsilon [Candidatus Collierbacteria bacterium CG10_big_fil_rev_8_21_14_0_10_44_9]
MSKNLTLDIVTQEKRLLTVETSRVTVETEMGEITVLPGHIPLLAKLTQGLLRFEDTKGGEVIVAIFGGFLEVDSEDKVSILADSAVRAEDIDLAKVQLAEKEAKITLSDKTREIEYAQAEAALKRTWLELKAANSKPRHSTT